jgi:hypothetical protein
MFLLVALKMSLNAYCAYGLSIHTDLVCPELPLHPHPVHDPDVTITLLPQEAGTLCPLPDRSYEVQPGCFLLDVPGVARYRVEEGKRIFIEPLANASPENVRLFLLGSTMGALLYQRGLFPLHGSAVETPWGGMIFVGAQGSGKSTLAAEFRRFGYRLLSDDVSAIENTPQGLRILPALAQLRLCASAYERLGESPEAFFDVDKFAVPMGDGYCPDPVPLRAIHILSDQTAELPRFEVVRGLDRVRRLFENLYRPHFLKGQRTHNDLVCMAGVIAQHATLAAVSRERDTTVPGDLVRFLELSWAERFGRVSTSEKN